MDPIVHFEVQVRKDLKKTKEYYEKVHGWKIEQMMKKEKGGMDYWGLKTRKDGEPGINGGMYEKQPDGEEFRLFDCTLQVKDIDKTIKDIKANVAIDAAKFGRPAPSGK